MIEEGFTYNKKDNVYETWYTIKDTNQDTRTKKQEKEDIRSDIEKACAILDSDELDLYDSP